MSDFIECLIYSSIAIIFMIILLIFDYQMKFKFNGWLSITCLNRNCYYYCFYDNDKYYKNILKSKS